MDPFNPEYISKLYVKSQIQQNQGAQQDANVNEVQGQHNIAQVEEQAKIMMRK